MPKTYFSEVGFSNLLHLGKHHRRDFFWVEGLSLTLVFNLNLGSGVVIDDIKWPMLHIRLHNCVVKPATNQSFSVCKRKNMVYFETRVA